MIMKNVPIVLVLMISALIISCNSNTYEEISGTNIAAEIVSNPTYEKNVKQIVANNCTSCHSPSSIDQQPYLRDFNEVKGAIINGSFICRIDGTCGQIMPQSGRMSQTTIDLIKLWKTQGFVN